MINGRRIGVVLPAYNAEATLARTVAELDREVVDEIVLVDDGSTDQTVSLARKLGLEPIRHELNLGYGGNQKTCYRRVLELGADVVVMVHPDYQYSPLLVPAMASMIAYGEYDLVLGSRILAQNSVARGMPRYKYVANRFLTFVENIFLQQKLSEYHTGLRAFSRTLLDSLPFDRNSDDFIFDNQILAQAVSVGARIGEVSCPTRYQADASSINLRRSIRYGLGVLRTSGQYRMHKHGLRPLPLPRLRPRRGARPAPSARQPGGGRQARGEREEREERVRAGGQARGIDSHRLARSLTGPGGPSRSGECRSHLTRMPRSAGIRVKPGGPAGGRSRRRATTSRAC